MSGLNPSLAHYFDAPDGYVGHFGWICGYSADATFLNEAAERFTRQTMRQRAMIGKVSLAIMLEPGQPAIPPVEVPGLTHLPLKSITNKPFRLLHAKLALLAYRSIGEDEGWKLRLIISTGNWTRQTLEESIDLVWSIEVNSEDLDGQDEDLTLRRADLGKAWNLLTYLHGIFDIRILDAGMERADGGAKAAADDLAAWIRQCALNGQSRLFDNRHKALLAQMPALVQASSGDSRRSYLAMGSGFFEGASTQDNPSAPTVLSAIVNALCAKNLMKKLGTVDIFVNPEACQSVASTLDHMRSHNKWQVRAAATDKFGQVNRKLHAKFLFGANQRKGSPNCLHAWVYLGSGNLTGPGFANAMSRHSGNLEVGVIFKPENLRWEPKHASSVQAYLPVQWDSEFTSSDGLGQGEPPPPLAEPYVAPPVAWLNWLPKEGGGYLHPLPGSGEWFVLDPAEQRCATASDGFIWSGDQPRQVRIEWQDGTHLRKVFIPVMDGYGRLAAMPIGKLTMDEVWPALAGFPGAPIGEQDEFEDILAIEQGAATSGGGVEVRQSYPIRQMMELIEQIAQRQTEMPGRDWGAWCVRLEQTLACTSESPVLEYFRTLELNPLSPLREAAFRPTYAESGRAGFLYEGMLDRIETRWGVDHLKNIGGMP